MSNNNQQEPDTGILIEPAYELGGILHKINANTLNLQRYIQTKPEYRIPTPNGSVRFWPYHTFPLEFRDPTYLNCPIWNSGFGVLDNRSEQVNKFTAKQDLKEQSIIHAAYDDLAVFNNQ